MRKRGGGGLVSHARALAWDTARMTDRLLAFAGVCVLLTFVPGVDTAMVTRSALARGTRAGVQTALGAASELFVHTAAVALGVSAMLARSAAGFEVLRLCGACYLVVLGVLTLRGAGAGQDRSADDAGPARRLRLGRLRPLLQRPRVRRIQERIGGGVLDGLGARLTVGVSQAGTVTGSICCSLMLTGLGLRRWHRQAITAWRS